MYNNSRSVSALINILVILSLDIFNCLDADKKQKYFPLIKGCLEI